MILIGLPDIVWETMSGLVGENVAEIEFRSRKLGYHLLRNIFRLLPHTDLIVFTHLMERFLNAGHGCLCVK